MNGTPLGEPRDDRPITTTSQKLVTLGAIGCLLLIGLALIAALLGAAVTLWRAGL